MKILAFTFLFLVAFLGAVTPHAYANDGDRIPTASVAPLAEWVSKAMNVDMAILPTAIVSDHGLKSALRLEDAQKAGAAGAYIPGIVYLSPSVWKSDSLQAASYLVHELVHHAQLISGRIYACNAAKEREAYTLQDAWLKEHGTRAIIGPDQINRLSSCDQGKSDSNK